MDYIEKAKLISCYLPVFSPRHDSQTRKQIKNGELEVKIKEEMGSEHLAALYEFTSLNPNQTISQSTE